MFNFDSFTELANPRDLAKIFEAVEYAAWKSFRESEDSRYVALAMPRVLARLPYGAELQAGQRVQLRGGGRRQGAQQLLLDGRGLGLRGADHRRLRPVRLDGPDPRRRGRRQGRGPAGAHLPHRRRRRRHEVPDRDRHLRPPRVRAVQPRLPAAAARKGSDFAVFMGAQSCQKPKTYFDPAANANAELSAKFNLHPLHLALRPLPQGDGARQDRLVHGGRRLRRLAQQLDQATTSSPIPRTSATTIKAE